MQDSATATMTVRLPKALLDQLDQEAERRSQLAGGPGLISRNAMLRLAVEAGLQALAAPPAPAPVQTPTKQAPLVAKAPKAEEDTYRQRVRDSGLSQREF